MSGNPKITVGERLPLTMTTVDDAKGLEVVAVVTDAFGKQIASEKMTEPGPGVYVNLDVIMPDVPFVVVKYFINNSDLYAVCSERFDSQPKPSEPAKFVEGQVTSRKKLTEYVSGEVINEDPI